MPSVEVEALVKRYPSSKVNALDGVSFSVAPGEVFGLLGPNGAGKTTTVGILTTRIRPTSGSARIGGTDVAADPVLARSSLAVVPQRVNLDRSLSVRQNLLFHAAYHGVPQATAKARAGELLEEFGLSSRAKDKVDRLSGGQAQRVMVARALMHAPGVLFLDEPTTGLDPAARLFVWERIRSLPGSGVTVVLTTHDMHEAEELADRVAIMDHGHVLALDTPNALMRMLGGAQMLDLTIDIDPERSTGMVAELGRLDGVERVEPMANGRSGALRARMYAGGEASRLVEPVARLLAERGAVLADLAVGRATLEDVFIHYTGRGLR